jgi:hypothetical protein
VKYSESGQEFTLYIQAKSEGEKEEWIQLLRSVFSFKQKVPTFFVPEINIQQLCHVLVSSFWRERNIGNRKD